MSVSCFPLKEEVLEYYVISISHCVAYQTIKVYLCGVQFFSHLHGWSSSRICDMMSLRYVAFGGVLVPVGYGPEDFLSL